MTPELPLPVARKLKIYWYPQVPRSITEDTELDDPRKGRYMPFDRIGRDEWLEFVDDPEKADFFFAGEVAPESSCDLYPRELPDVSTLTFFERFPRKHIFLVVEDFRWAFVPKFVARGIISTPGGSDYFVDTPMFVTPLLSQLIKYQCANLLLDTDVTMPDTATFAFRGQESGHIPWHSQEHFLQHRSLLHKAFVLSKAPGLFEFASDWGMWAEPTSEKSLTFQQLCKDHLLQLCPQGRGPHSPRSYECSYYGRIPVLFGGELGSRLRMMGHDFYDTSFAFSIPASEDVLDVIDQLRAIGATPIKELHERAWCAKRYFDDVVRPYFLDPTKMFIRYLLWWKETNL